MQSTRQETGFPPPGAVGYAVIPPPLRRKCWRGKALWTRGGGLHIRCGLKTLCFAG